MKNNILWKRVGVLVLFMVVIALAAISFGYLQWSENVADILPQSAELSDYSELVRVFRPDDRVFFLVKAAGADIPGQKLVEAADELADGLEKPGKDNVRLFSRVIYRQDIDPLEAIDFYLSHQGNYFDRAMQEAASGRLNGQWLSERFAGVRKQLMISPAPGLMKLVSNDPVNLSEAGFKALQELLPGGGGLRLHRGRLFGEDLRKVLIIAEPTVKGTDIGGARILVDRVEQLLAHIRQNNPGIETAWLAGHRFSVDNAGIIRKDVTRIFILSSILIISMIWLVLRRVVYVLLLALPPVFGLASALSAVTVTRGTVSAMALGMAAILSGITIDYGIHILCHGRAVGSAHEAALKLRRPLLLAAATTAIAFVSLHFSGIGVMEQLGDIAVFSVIGAAAFALFCLPRLISWWGMRPQPGGAPGRVNFDIGRAARNLLQLHNKKKIIALVVLTLLLVPGLGLLEVEGDLQNFNAMSERNRRDFDEIGDLIAINRKTVFIALHDENLQNVLERNSRLFAVLGKIKETGEIKGISSIAGILPSPSMQEANLERWKKYWNNERRDLLSAALEKAAARSGMRFAAFRAYLNRLTDEPGPAVKLQNLPPNLKQLVNEHLQTDGEKTYVLTRVEPAANCDIVKMADRLRASFPGVVIADMSMLRFSAMKLFMNGLLKLGAIVLVSVGIFLLLILRDLRRFFALILPLLLTVFWTFGLLGLLRVKIDASSSIVSVVIFGLVIDYSIFITDSIKRRKQSGGGFGVVAAAVTLSGLSTIFGFGSLIIARHPVLYSCGITAIAGTCCGWLAVSLSSSLYNKILKK